MVPAAFSISLVSSLVRGSVDACVHYRSISVFFTNCVWVVWEGGEGGGGVIGTVGGLKDCANRDCKARLCYIFNLLGVFTGQGVRGRPGGGGQGGLEGGSPVRVGWLYTGVYHDHKLRVCSSQSRSGVFTGQGVSGRLCVVVGGGVWGGGGWIGGSVCVYGCKHLGKHDISVLICCS
jgi:hypothetical protein